MKNIDDFPEDVRPSVIEFTNDICRQTILDVINVCYEICDKNRGHLSLGDKILEHFGIVKVEKTEIKKPKFKVIK